MQREDHGTIDGQLAHPARQRLNVVDVLGTVQRDQ
jgi:hypothetical protein